MPRVRNQASAGSHRPPATAADILVTDAKAEAPAPGAAETDHASPMEQRWGGYPYPSEAILGPALNLIGRPRGPRMRCGWGCSAQLTGRNMRAHFTMARSGRRPPATWSDDEGGARKPTVAVHWGGECRAAGTRRPTEGEPDARALHNMPETAVFHHVDQRRRNSKARCGLPPGPRMRCGWGCGGWLTEHEMRAAFRRCPNRPAVSPQVNTGTLDAETESQARARQGGECWAVALWDPGQRRRRRFSPLSSSPRTRANCVPPKRGFDPNLQVARNPLGWLRQVQIYGSTSRRPNSRPSFNKQQARAPAGGFSAAHGK
jgi:hypothetical protein